VSTAVPSHVGLLDDLARGWKAKLSADRVSRFIEWLNAHIGEARCVVRHANVIQIEVDLSQISFRRMGCLPLLAVGGDAPFTLEVKALVLKFASAFWHSPQMPIFACFSNEAKVLVLDCLSKYKHRAGVVLGRDELERIFLDPNNVDAIRKCILEQIEFSDLVPYDFTHPTSGTLFVGRQRELRWLLRQAHVNYAICGPARTGKSSLLHQMNWELRRELDPRAKRFIEVDLYTSKTSALDVMKAIAIEVDPSSSIYDVDSFLKLLETASKKVFGGQIELVIDEADEALSEDKACGYPLLRVLRDANRQGWIRVTICGISKTKAVMDDLSNPFGKRMKLVELGPLDIASCKNLILSPLRDLGVTFFDEKFVIDKVMGATLGRALEVQRWGMAISDKAGGRPNRHIDKITFNEVIKDEA